MIDIADLRAKARNQALPCTGGGKGVVVSPEFLEQVAVELEAGRIAQDALSRSGRTFGLKGSTL